MAAVLVGVLFSVGFFSDLGVLFGVLFMVELRIGVFWTVGSVGWGSSCSMTGGNFVSVVVVVVMMMLLLLLFSLF